MTQANASKGKRAPRGPDVNECKALFSALLTMLPEDQHNAAVDEWSGQKIADEIASRLSVSPKPTDRTIQRMLVKEGYRPPKGAGKASGEFSDATWDDPEHPQRRRVGF